MVADPTRPDPDALLARLNAEESRARQGRLRVFFGFAPGVGKTFRMLQVARTLVEEGSDVVVGVIETHGRYDTAALMLGLDILPPRVVEYRGRRLTELDLDAALARRPGVLLVDELAHTNAPGSRHPKRWQDVIELVEAGVDVFTTLNVQHVESLNDVVAQITGARVRETVPDEVLARADLVELVDISPEELLERLREGRVYLPEEAARATQHFFRRGNLLALRELALRRVAERVDVDVQAWRAQEGVGATWHTAERVLVCVGPSPSSLRLVRAGRRMAAGMRAPWIAAWVEPARGLSAADEARLDSHLATAEALGAEVVRLQGPSVAAAILDYARRRNVTRIVIGKATHTRWRDRLSGSLLDEVVRGSGEIDVLVITGDEARSDDDPRRAAGEGAPSSPASYLGAAGMVALATGVTWGVRAFLAAPDMVMVYLIVVAGVAMRFGRGPSLLAAALSVVAYDVFFVPPYFTLAVAEGRHALTFAVMFAAGLVLSSLTGRIRRQEQSARDREARTAALLALSRDLGSGASEREVLTTLVERASQVFATPVAAWTPTAEGGLGVAVATGGSTADTEPMARWCFEHGRPAGAGTDTLPGQPTLCVPIRGRAEVLGVLAVDGALDAARRDLLDAFVRQGSLALERARLVESVRSASERAREEAARSALLSAVSHDLRTPLATITGAATTLRDDDGALSAAQRDDLIDAVCDEAERMERMVTNLLDMTRIAAGAVRVRREWVPLEELVGSALRRLEKTLGGRPVSIAVPPSLPPLSVDPILFEQVLVNLLENAARHTPPGTSIDISAEPTDGGVALTVADRGPGLPPGEERRVFERFYRGPRATAPGAGLGLAICEGVVHAHGGTIAARQREGGGAEFRVEVPLPEGAPTLEREGEP